jgi:hypothetical protein
MGLSVTMVDAAAQTRYSPTTVYVKEVHSYVSKSVRAEPVASLYEAGRVSHVVGADLSDLEEWLTTWEPGPGVSSPDSMDALVHGAWELARIGEKSVVDKRASFAGIGALAKGIETAQRAQPSRSLMSTFGRGRRGGDKL